MDEIVTIDLFGEEFRFKPDDQVKNPEQIAQYLKKYITDAETMFPNKTITGKNKLAILLLAAMNLSKDFYELKVQYTELEAQIDTGISSLLRKIDKKGIE